MHVLGNIGTVAFIPGAAGPRSGNHTGRNTGLDTFNDLHIVGNHISLAHFTHHFNAFLIGKEEFSRSREAAGSVASRRSAIRTRVYPAATNLYTVMQVRACTPAG